MPAYSFKKQFVPLVANGAKTHTIRAPRKRCAAPQVGETVSLYYGMRTKQCTLIGRSCITKVEEIIIEGLRPITEYRDGDHRYSIFPKITIDGDELSCGEMERLAVADGFADLFTMMQFWWWDRLPFRGYIIHWKSMNRYVPHTDADKCWCQPLAGKGHRHPKCPMHGNRAQEKANRK